MAWQRGRAYGQDLRDRVLAADGSVREVAERFAVSDSYVARARAKRRHRGEVCAEVQRSHVCRRGCPAWSRRWPLNQTLAQLCDWAQREHCVQVGGTRCRSRSPGWA